LKIANLLSIFYQTLNIKLTRLFGTAPRGPLVIFLALTEKCNLKCKICNIGRDGQGKGKSELSKEKIFVFLSDAASMGVKIIALWGGEPLLNKDLEEVVNEIHRLKMSTYLVTNGYLLNESKVSELVRCKINSVSVSIDDPFAETHDEIRGIKGAFEKICKGVRMLKEKGGDEIKVGINMVVSRENYKEILKMLDLAISLKAEWVKFLPVHFGYPYNHREFGDKELMPTEEQIDEIHRSMKELQREVKKNGLYTNSEVYLDTFREFFRGEYVLKNCYAGYLCCNVDSFGDVTQCSLDPRIAGNIREKSFRKIWKSEKFKAIRNDHNQKLCGHCWVSCFAELSLRISLKYSLAIIKRVLREVSYLKT